jgi:hypothetical protein
MATLHDIKRLDVTAEVTGTRERYDVAVSSNADRVVGEIVGRQFREQAARFEAQLQAAVEAQVAQPVAELKRSAGGLDGLVRELTGRINLGSDVLKNAVVPKSGIKLPF